jgi:hypothetical protein
MSEKIDKAEALRRLETIKAYMEGQQNPTSESYRQAYLRGLNDAIEIIGSMRETD